MLLNIENSYCLRVVIENTEVCQSGLPSVAERSASSTGILALALTWIRMGQPRDFSDPISVHLSQNLF